jgi:hypothetical protein
MRWAALAATVAVLAAVPAAAASAALPRHGVLVPGVSLAGVRLGMTPAQVRATWGLTFGVCRSCSARTWYFNYDPYQPQGAAVRFRRGRVDAVWTLWSPPGWHTQDSKLRLGLVEPQVHGVLGALVTIPCGSYIALILTRKSATTVYYVFGGKLWGFGLSRPGASPCHG